MNTNNGRTNVEQAASAFAEAMSKYPIEEQLAVGLIAKNVLNGCSWEFTRTMPEIRKNLDAFKKSKTCSVQEVTYDHRKKIYGYLVYMKMDRLCELLSSKNHGIFDAHDLELANKHRKEASTALIKKMKSGYNGKIGIFCTNDSQSITVDGKSYPAFAVSLKELCVICQQVGYGIMISGAVRNPRDVLDREDAVLKSLTVAPSSNAVFIDIAPLN